MSSLQFNPPPGWPIRDKGWLPPAGWKPDGAWPPAPPGWVFWVSVEDTVDETSASTTEHDVRHTEAPLTVATGSRSFASSAGLASEPQRRVSSDKASGDTEGGVEDEAAQANRRLKAIEAEITMRGRELEQLESTIESAKHRSASIVGEIRREAEAQIHEELVELNDALLLQQVGIYEYHHPLENAEMFKERLRKLQDDIRSCIRSGKAVLASEMFSYNSSLAKGRKMTSDLSKLMLRAYNSEADNCVRSLRAGTIAAAKKRLDTSAATIARLGGTMEMHVSDEYHNLRLFELELTSDYLFKKQEERERGREERARLREEIRVARELEEERERLLKERAHYANALQTIIRSSGADTADLQARLNLIDQALAMNEYRAANVRCGVVYVISNVGSFGRNIVKIGLTRRLEPMDRVRELGDASVPFPFDVHVLYFSDDAVTLENELHKVFASRKVNQINRRREFFFATPEEVKQVLIEKVGNLLEFTDEPVAAQFFQSRGYWPSESAPESQGPSIAAS